MHPLLRLFRYAKGYHSRVWFASVCTILNKLCDLAPAYLIGVAVDIVVEREDSFIANGNVLDLKD